MPISSLSFCTWTGPNPHEQLCWFTPEYSLLWQPVLRFPTLGQPTAAMGIYCGIVFAYLAAPLVRNLLLAPRAWIAPAVAGLRRGDWQL